MDQPLQSRAVEVLTESLHSDSMRVRIFAAEALLWHNLHLDEVRGTLQKQVDEASPSLRIRMLKILYHAAATHEERSRYLQTIHSTASSKTDLDDWFGEISAPQEKVPSSQSERERAREDAVSRIKQDSLPGSSSVLEDLLVLGEVGTLEDIGLLVPFLDGTSPVCRAAAAHSILRIMRRIPHRLQAADWCVIGIYAGVMLFIGLYYSLRTKTTEDYLLGGRRMKSWTVGLSLFASLLSTITYLAGPGEMIRYGPMYLGALLSYPFVIWIVGWFLIPFIMQTPVTSAYEILETRLGIVPRLLGSLFFLSMRLIWMAVIIYATTSKVLVPMLGWGREATPYICAVLGLITVVYTSMGGLKAVVLTDVLQTFILFGAAVLTLLIISFELGGVSSWWPTSWPAHWPEPEFGYDPNARMSLMGIMVAYFTWHVCTSASDQMAVQRYLSTRDVRAARRTLIVSMSASALVGTFLGFVGLALLAFYQKFPQFLPDGPGLINNTDRLFPRYIVLGLPVGISGLVIAGLLSAAMSSLSSGVNSSCSVITVDFLDRFRKSESTSRQRVFTAKLVSLAVGLVVIVLSSWVGLVHGNLLEVAYKTVNLLVAPLAGLFFLAFFVPWATSFGAVVGAMVGLSVVVSINYWEEMTGVRGISFIWAMPLGLFAEMIFGSLASLLPVGKKRSVDLR